MHFVHVHVVHKLEKSIVITLRSHRILHQQISKRIQTTPGDPGPDQTTPGDPDLDQYWFISTFTNKDMLI